MKCKMFLIKIIRYIIPTILALMITYSRLFIYRVSSNECINIEYEDGVVLSQTDDAGHEYIQKLYFVGDSTSYHFYKGGIDKSHILVPESLTLKLSSNIDKIIVGNNGLTIGEEIKEAKAEIAIITIGVNGADYFTEIKYKTYYKKLIKSIQEHSPQTKIIIQSVFPVTNDFNDKNLGITNKGINQLNEWAKEIAFELNLRYLDTQSILKDENGSQIDSYNVNDGVHMNEEAYHAILYYIRTHAIN